MKKCPDHFKGEVEDFIQSYKENFLSNTQVGLAHQQIKNHLLNKQLLVTRNFSNYQAAARLNSSSDDLIKFVVGDNEPIVWFWRHLYNNIDFNLSDSVLSQIIPISMAPQEGEAKNDWLKWGSGDELKTDRKWRGVNGGKWKLCHIFQAAPEHLGDDEKSIQARFVRNFHPLNHFWFASEYKWKQGHFEMNPTRLGEQSEVCLTYWKHYKNIYRDYIEWFIEHALVIESEILSAGSLNPFIEFSWINSESKAVLPKRTFSTTTTSALKSLDILEVKESKNGTFNLSGFGVKYSGENGDGQFSIRVLDRQGNLLAESEVTSASRLNIGSSGRDYLANRYSQSNLMLRSTSGKLEVNSSVAKKLVWEFF